MNDIDENFVQGFLGEVKKAGASDNEATVLLEQYALLDLLNKDAAFREGFIDHMEKEGQHFWKNTLGGMAAGAGTGGLFGSVPGAVIGGVIGGIGGAARGVYKNLTDPKNVAEKYNKQKQDYMNQRAEQDKMYGVNQQPNFGGGYGGPGGGYGGPTPPSWMGSPYPSRYRSYPRGGYGMRGYSAGWY